jgi:hypothetical protein
MLETLQWITCKKQPKDDGSHNLAEGLTTKESTLEKC